MRQKVRQEIVAVILALSFVNSIEGDYKTTLLWAEVLS
jgi:hypothetical protein